MTRTLLYVPILHSSADMGSVAPEAEKRGVKLLGEDGWNRHKAAISKFWDSIAEHLNSLDVKSFKLYQDTLVSDGEAALKMIETAAVRGSKNYEILSGLIKRGAILVKTEDLALVQKEVEQIKGMAHSETKLGKFVAALKYKLTKAKMLLERDEFIAKRIAETLKDGETGIIFIGAFHDVNSKLPADIRVNELKEKSKVEKYQNVFFQKNKGPEIAGLEEYLKAPVERSERGPEKA